MAGRSYNLGDFSSRLGVSPEELEKAYSLAGGNPQELVASAAPSRDPMVPPASTPEPEAPRDMSVSRAPGSPARAIDSYQRENLADRNERIAIAGRSGDGSGLDKQAYLDQAAILEKKGKADKANTDAAKAEVGSRKEHEKRYQKEADDLYEEMKAHRKPPSESLMTKILGAIAVAGSIGGNKGLAQGSAMLSGMFGNNSDRWAQEQAANSDLYKNALGMISKDREGAEHDLNVAAKVSALESLEFDDALEQAKAMGLGRNAERIATDLQLKLREDTRNGLIGIQQAKAAAAAKAGLNAREKYFWDIPIEQLRQMPSQILGEKGQEVLAKRNKNDQDYEERKATILKKQGEAGEGAPQEILPGLVATVPLEKRDVSDIRKNRAVLTDVLGDIQKLSEIRSRNKGNLINDRTDVADAAQIIDGLSGKMSQLSGRGAPSEAERQAIIANLLNPTDTYLATEPMKVYAALRDRLENNFNNSIESIGIRNADGTPLTSKTFQKGTRGVASQGPAGGSRPVQAPVNPNAPVEMMDLKTGRGYRVHPSRVEAMKAQGWRPMSDFDPIANRNKAEAEEAAARAARNAPPPVVQGPEYAEMSDEDYERQALLDAGY